MFRHLFALGSISLVSILIITGCGAANSAQPTAQVAIATSAPTATAEPTATIEPTATAQPTITPEPTVEPTATAEPTAAPTATAEPTAAPTATVEPTAAPTAKPKPTALPKPAAAAVTIKLFMFQPNPIEIKAGSQVRWTNSDDIEHSVTSGTPPSASGAFDSGFFTKGQSYAFTFTEPGEYAYFCMRHNSMTGVVRVVQ